MSPTDLRSDGTFDQKISSKRLALSSTRSWTHAGPLPRLFSHLSIPLYKNGYSLILSSATSSGLGMLFWALAAHYYPVETIGTSSAIIAAMMFLSGVSQRGVNSALVRFMPLAGRASARLVGVTYLISLVVAGAATLVIGRFFYHLFPILGVLGGGLLPLLLFAGLVMIWSVFTLQDSVLTGLGQAHWVPIENTIVSAVKLVLLVLLATWIPIEGVLSSWLLPVVLSVVPVNLLIFRRLLPAHIKTTANQAEPLALRPIVKFVSGNHLASLLMLAYTTLLPVIVASQAGARANAYFYPPWMIATSLQLVAINMTTSLTVEGTRDRPQLRVYGYRVLVRVMQLLVPVIAIILIGAPWILRIFGANYAAEGSELLRWLALSTLPNTIVVLYIALERVQNRVAGIIVVQGALCVLVLTLSYRLLAEYGIAGVGVAVLASQTLVAIGLLIPQLRNWWRQVKE
jgi:O-antigen/teichoic acid export membrane protein